MTEFGTDQHPSAPATATVVLFDASCPPCVELARWAERRAAGALRFIAWDDFRASEEGLVTLSENERQRPGDRLRVIAGGALLEGDAAWSVLVSEHPSLTGLDWFARRLGMAPMAARTFRATGDLVRRFCSRCPSSLR